MNGVQQQNQLVTVNKSNENSGEDNIAESILTPTIREEGENFLDDEEICAWVIDNVCDITQQVRNDYQPIHAEWIKINRMLTMEMEEDASYKGETQVYLPTFAKAIETRVAHICKASFPTDTFFDVLSLKVETPEESNARQASKAWMKRQIETNAKLRSKLNPFARNVCAYGVGFFKVWWEDELVKQHKKRNKYGTTAVAQAMAGKTAKKCGKLRVKATNNFATYAYPMSVDSLEQCTLIFEDIQVSRMYCETMIKYGYWKEDSIQFTSTEPDTEQFRQEALVQNAKTAQTAISGGAGGQLGQYTNLTECWFSMPLPERYFTEEEIAASEHLQPQPMKAVICGQNIVSVERNPFNHGKPPYLMKKLIEQADVLITPGYGKLVMTSQYLINDLVNQVNDNGIFGLNPMGMRDITKIAGHSLKQTMQPGAMFDILEKGAIEFTRPPVEQIAYGQQLIGMAKAEVNDVIAPPILQGTGSGGGGAASTATGAQLLQANTKTDIQNFNEDLEQEVFMPLMEMAQSLGQQYESSEMYLAITGQQKVQFKPEYLAMELSWQWVASSQTINQQMRGQQLSQFMATLLNPAVQQYFMQRGIVLNIESVIRKIWEDGLGQRSFETLIQRQEPALQPGTTGAGAPPVPGTMSPGNTPLSPEQISSVSQNSNLPMPVTPTAGEGEQFRSVREGAEDMSGAMGILGNLPR